MKKLFFLFAFLTSVLFSHSQTIEDVWNEGITCFNEKDFHGTIQKMNQIISVLPQYPYAYYNKGIAKLNLGDVDEACADISKAVSLGFDKNSKFYDYLCNSDMKLKLLKKQFYPHDELYRDNGYRPHYTRKDTLRGALRPERTCYDVYFYDLTVRIIPRGKKITGKNVIWFLVKEPTKRIQIDLFDYYTLSEISWKGTPLKFTREYNAIFVDFPEQLNPGEKHNISVTYYGKPEIAKNPPWQGGFVWKRDKHRKLWAGVACEHLGASSWWPNKDHLSDKPDSMKISFEAPGKYKVVSNGVLRNSYPIDKKWRRFDWFVSYPINNYNVTFYLGEFEHITDSVELNGQKLMLKYDVLPYNLEKAKEHFQQTKDLLKYYNSVFGQYPFMRDGYGLVESPYEGMEHQTAIAYGHGFNNTTFEGCGDIKYDYIIVHESAHEWWGNAVTAADMADIWIHEGFATYAELLYLEHCCGKKVYLEELNNKLKMIFNFWPMVENYNVNENSFASNDVYDKGAVMLHCLRCTIDNDSLFFDIIRNFNLKFRYQSVSSKDFIDFVNQQTGEDYNPFFDKYLYDTKLPVLNYNFTAKGDSLVLTYKWTEVEKGFTMPFCIKTNDGRAVRLVGSTTEEKISLEDVNSFIFYNEWQDLDGVADNAYTYFRTKWEE